MTDRQRQVLVTGSAGLMIVGTLYGFGLLGAPVEATSSGAFSAEATLLAPAVRAFSIWSVIYLGLIAYVVWQWLPANTASARARRIGALSALSMVLNGLWLAVVQVGGIWLSVAVIVALALTLGVLVQRLGDSADASPFERIVLDLTFGLYLGWVSVATLANVTTALVASGFDPAPAIAEYWAVGVLALGAMLGVLLAMALGGRLSVAGAMAWGLAWIAVGRFAGNPTSFATGVAATLAVVVILGATVLVLLPRITARPSVATVLR